MTYKTREALGPFREGSVSLCGYRGERSVSGKTKRDHAIDAGFDQGAPIGAFGFAALEPPPRAADDERFRAVGNVALQIVEETGHRAACNRGLAVSLGATRFPVQGLPDARTE